VADTPEIAEAKAKLRELVGPAVEVLEELMQSEHDGIRLGASKEVLDRGGVPAKQDHTINVEIGIDSEIESVIARVQAQLSKSDTSEFDIEDAEIVSDEDEVSQLPAGEQAGLLIGVPLDEIAEEAEVVEDPPAWWQAVPDN